jgi:hypothetical protein
MMKATASSTRLPFMMNFLKSWTMDTGDCLPGKSLVNLGAQE